MILTCTPQDRELTLPRDGFSEEVQVERCIKGASKDHDISHGSIISTEFAIRIDILNWCNSLISLPRAKGIPFQNANTPPSAPATAQYVVDPPRTCSGSWPTGVFKMGHTGRSREIRDQVRILGYNIIFVGRMNKFLVSVGIFAVVRSLGRLCKGFTLALALALAVSVSVRLSD
eukprot:scaffold249360_cov114-Cyclotella_meneghiniana.AAC.3